MADPQYRRLYRRAVLATQLRAEVGAALTSRIGKSGGTSLGPAIPDLDFGLLGLNPPDQDQRLICMKAQNMAEMDTLLGDRWDVREDDGVVRFVTTLRLSVTALPVFGIRAAVTSGRFDGRLKKNGYRKQLAEYLSATEHAVASVAEHVASDVDDGSQTSEQAVGDDL